MSIVNDWLEESDELHARVQAFIRNPAAGSASFEELSLAIARYQVRNIPAFERLVRSHGGRLASLSDIPAVPAESFQLTRIAVHAPEHDQVRFLTSGTSSGSRGQHCMRRTDTYRLAALTWAEQLLVPEGHKDLLVVCLAPEPESQASSSLGFMMQAFLESFDCEAEPRRENRWLLSERGVDVAQLQLLLERAEQARRGVLLLATSFALAYLLEALNGRTLHFDGQLVMMQTGGFKGKSREFAPEELEQAIRRAFAGSELHFVSEYGMTELSSQLYDARVPGARIFTDTGWLLAPPWLYVSAVDPTSLQELSDGQPGLACFVDLANIDSALRILTEDRIIRRGQALKLLGRASKAPARGCSMGTEEIVTGSR
jgi:hypothetical protein